MTAFRILAFLVAIGIGSISAAPVARAEGETAGNVVQLLFVQNSHGVIVDKDKGTLTLKGISPTTVFFSDRPYRIAGHYTTEEYLAFWREGADSFLSDPPNATLSVFEAGQEDLVDLVVELRNPRLEGSDLSYDITILSGSMPRTGGPSSLFIDVIGMPLTPLSGAGVARRWTRRAVYADAAVTSEAASAHMAATPPPAESAPAAAQPQASAEQQLEELKTLYDKGLISKSDYEAKKQEILSHL